MSLSKTIITNEGFRAVNRYGSLGTHFAIKYFLPVYDPRIDSGIHTASQESTIGEGTDVMFLSATVSPSQVLSGTGISGISGEIIYNPQSTLIQTLAGVSASDEVYSISTEDYLVISGSNYTNDFDYGGVSPTVVTGASGTISDSAQSEPGTINLFGLSALSKTVSASDFSFDLSGSVSGTDLGFINSFTQPSFSSILTSAGTDRDHLFTLGGYTPANPIDDTDNRGKYFIRLSNTGNFKFNKILTFVVDIDATGDENTAVAPMLFSITPLNNVVEQKVGESSWEFVLDLSFYQADDLINGTVSATSDYWSRDVVEDNYTLVSTGQRVSITEEGIVDGFDPRSCRLNVVDSTNPQLRLSIDGTLANSTYFRSTSTGLDISAVNGIVNIYDNLNVIDTLSAVDVELSNNISASRYISFGDGFYTTSAAYLGYVQGSPTIAQFTHENNRTIPYFSNGFTISYNGQLSTAEFNIGGMGVGSFVIQGRSNFSGSVSTIANFSQQTTTIYNDTVVSADLIVSQALNVSGSINVTNDIVASGNVVGFNISAIGNVIVDSTLYTDDLSATGSATFDENINVSGNVSASRLFGAPRQRTHFLVTSGAYNSLVSDNISYLYVSANNCEIILPQTSATSTGYTFYIAVGTNISGTKLQCAGTDNIHVSGTTSKIRY
jgi:hypothetical protein